ncbi:MAG: hypothetical protein QOH32_2864 [Bradyrhizobium sp.]|nr:hypothetical protein [Bradyrhizobium sp.]
MPSSVIRSYSYSAKNRELTITFVSGRRYVYTDVPQEEFDAFKAAKSKGSYFNSEIRDCYSCFQVSR